jgi:molecular chaperone DnaK (HSP70)
MNTTQAILEVDSYFPDGGDFVSSLSCARFEVGGPTNIPKIQKMLSEFFNNRALNKSNNPDEAVACGRAIQAAIPIKDQHPSIHDLLLLDVNPLSLGIDLTGGIATPVIERNSLIPIQNVETAGIIKQKSVFEVIECCTYDNIDLII